MARICDICRKSVNTKVFDGKLVRPSFIQLGPDKNHRHDLCPRCAMALNQYIERMIGGDKIEAAKKVLRKGE